MKALSVYDPPQCCSTGVCGPDQDDTMAQFAAALDWLRDQGVQIDRYNLGHQPGAFVQNTTVKSTIDKDGMECLPMIIVDGQIAKKGGYMSREEMAATLGIAAKPANCGSPAKATKSCCG